jgi:hypothetical protein
MRKSARKLALSRETIRTLQDSELTRIVGGNTGPVEIPPNAVPGTGGEAPNQMTSGAYCYPQLRP